jgi:hypothetical protein
MVHFYNNVSIDGTITNLELNNNTTNINTISGKIKYITCISGNTLVNSSIYVKDFSNPTQYVCKLANDVHQLSYIRSDLTIEGNVDIKGGITNTELNNNTDAITTISGKVKYITSNFDIGNNTSISFKQCIQYLGSFKLYAETIYVDDLLFQIVKDCQILRIGGKSWQKGKIKIKMSISPRNNSNYVDLGKMMLK